MPGNLWVYFHFLRLDQRSWTTLYNNYEPLSHHVMTCYFLVSVKQCVWYNDVVRQESHVLAHMKVPAGKKRNLMCLNGPFNP